MKKKNKSVLRFRAFRLMTIRLWFLSLLLLGVSDNAIAQDNRSADARDKRIEELETAVQRLMSEIEALKQEQQKEKEQLEEQEKSISKLNNRMEEEDQSPALDDKSWTDRFVLGGYGELHANLTTDEGNDRLDFHRLVAFVGYEFSDWIKFNSEIELEHAFVTDESGGELVIEQAYFDFQLKDALNVRAGRVLTPLGIINKNHMPTTFNGVERPSFARFIIPTTWPSDGAGMFGSLLPSLNYEIYLVAGLDGSQFNAINGIRDGRIFERPSLNDPAVTARMDFYPFAEREVGYGQRLRLGLSTYIGGLNNGNNGKDPGIDGDIQIYSGDFQYSISDWDFRGAVAYQKINGALEIGNGTAEEIFGWYLEAAYHLWPDSFKRGFLRKSDLVLFVRYDDYDTQFKMPFGVPKDPRGDRQELTAGLSFFIRSNLVFKADYQFRDDASDEGLPDLYNFGIGWTF
jgi:hypothetical protein